MRVLAVALVALTTTTAAAAPDARIVKLARKAATSCRLDREQQFDRACPAYRAWLDNDELFVAGRGDDTIMRLLGDADVRLRRLAEDKGFRNFGDYFTTRQRGARLIELATRRGAERATGALARIIAQLDATGLGLDDELRALTGHPSVAFREELSMAIAYHQNATTLAIVKTLAADRVQSVRHRTYFHFGAHGPAWPPGCQLLVEWIAIDGGDGAHALSAAAGSRCPIGNDVASQLERRIGKPMDVATANRHAMTTWSLCLNTRSRSAAKRGAAIAIQLTASRFDWLTRVHALSALALCDPAGAPPVLARLAQDPERLVATRAREVLADDVAEREQRNRDRRTDP